MSKAKKCDRCGKFYEKNVVIESKGSAFGDTIGGIKTVTKDGRTDEAFDLCDDCVKSLYEWKEEPNVDSRWIPCSERMPEDIDRRFFMCLVENHLEDPPMMCQCEEEYGFGFWKDIYDPETLGFVDSEFETMEELGYEKVLYWMPLPEPPESEEK